ncbi:MAG: hypothetical protein M3R70_03115 [Actinomycetota bacterium]|nr:hypothetical protein [Actinomycetota bacterium]
MDERERRIGRNEALFREVNERVERLTQRFQARDVPMEILCECGDSTCHERIEITTAAYEQLRSEPTHFAIEPGHEEAGVESVIGRHDGYVIVQKYRGGAAEIAEQLDPRS